MIGNELDKQVQDYIAYMRSTGTAVNTAVVIACAEGILLHEAPDLLSRVNLNKGWAQYVLQKMGFVKRKATSKAKITVEDFAQIKAEFLLEVKQVKFLQSLSSIWTMEAAGSKRVEVAGKDDKKQLTALLAGSLTGDFLPPQIIYQGKTTRCLPNYDFPEKWHITYSINHWSIETTMKEYLDNVLLPYVNEKWKALGLADNYLALVLFDNF